MKNLARAQIKALTRVLPMLASEEDCRTLDLRCGISSARVLAYTWSTGRLMCATRELAEGWKPPPIEVSRYRLARRPQIYYYLPGDGLHRARAAQQAGRHRIGAHIRSEAICRPTRHRLLSKAGRTFLYREVAGRGYMRRVPAGPLTPEEIQTLRDLGVRRRGDDRTRPIQR